MSGATAEPGTSRAMPPAQRHAQAQPPHSRYIALLLYAIAFGWIEGCVVVYLRDLYLDVAAGATVPITAVSLPTRTVNIEVVREASTIVVLGAVAWLSSARVAGRWGAFLVGFGIWDLMYYVTLWLLLGWPESLMTWDILFLIPVPWVAPVWTPVVVAALFVGVGTWLVYTEGRPRMWRWPDALVLLVAASIIVGSFLVESRAAVDHYVPERFAWWIYWPGVLLGVAWFVRVEQRQA